MDINAFKVLLFDTIEKHERASIYERSCTEKEVVFSAHIGDSCFLVKCIQTDSNKSYILK